MNHAARDRRLRWGTGIYRVLLFSYPSSFRQEFGTEMARVFRDRLRIELGEGDHMTLARFFARIGADWLTTTLREHAASLTERRLAHGRAGKTRALLIVCVATAAAACWLGIMETQLRQPAFIQRILIAVLIAAQSGVTLAVTNAPSRPGIVVAAMGACGLLALGASAVARNLTGPHFEGFAVVIGTALTVQAVLTWTTLWHRVRAISDPSA